MPSWDLLIARRRTLLFAFALLATALLPGLARLGSDNSPAVFFVQGSPELDAYQDFTSTFGRDEMVRLVLGGPGLWTSDGLRFLAHLEDAASKLEGVRAISGLATFLRRSSAWTPEDPETVAERADALPLARAAGWVGVTQSSARHPDTATVAIFLEDLAPEMRDRLLDDLEALLATVPAGIAARAVGLPVLNRALDRSSQEIGELFFPLLVVLAIVLLLAVVRDWRKITAVLAFVGGCELALLGTMGWVGVELNLVLAILPPLVFSIALATAVHLLMRFRDLWAAGTSAGTSPDAACVATLRDKSWAVVAAGATTALGFASLAMSQVTPVRQLGLWAAFGLVVMTLAALSIYPVLLRMAARGSSPPRHRAFEHRAAAWGRRCGAWAARRRGIVLTLGALLAVVAAAGLPRLRLETNALTYLSDEHPVRTDIEALESQGIGVATVELVVRREQPFDDLFALTDLRYELSDLPLTLAILDAGTLAESTSFRALENDEAGRQLLAAFLSEDRRAARLSIAVPIRGATELDPFQREVAERARTTFPDAEITLTGQLPLLLRAQSSLLVTLGASLGLTVLGVVVVLRLLLHGARLTLLALIPNLWPVLGVLGIMGWAQIPVDVATVMVASVVLGLAADDTLHALGHFRRLAGQHGNAEAAAKTLESTAAAFVLTALILVAGFGICALSSFAPTARFGGLAASAVGIALLGDLVLLPALLSTAPAKTLKRFARPRKFTGV